MVKSHSRSYRTRLQTLIAPVIGCVALVEAVTPLAAQPTASTGQPQDTAVPLSTRPNNTNNFDERTKLLKQSQQALQDRAVEDMLQKRVSVTVRDGLVKDIVISLQSSGFKLPIEVRNVPDIHITLGVRGATARSVLTSAALFSNSVLCILPDHILITPLGFLAPNEKRYAETQDTSPLHQNQTNLFLRTLAAEMTTMGAQRVAVGDLSPFMQQICQRIADQLAADQRQMVFKLLPDTIISYKQMEGASNAFGIEIVIKSQGVKYFCHFTDNSKRS